MGTNPNDKPRRIGPAKRKRKKLSAKAMADFDRRREKDNARWAKKAKPLKMLDLDGDDLNTLQTLLIHDDEILGGLVKNLDPETANRLRQRVGLTPHRPTRRPGCSCYAGIVADRVGNRIERCDECALFDDDNDAMGATVELLRLLADEYAKGPGESGENAVADALELLIDKLRTFDETFEVVE